MADYKVRNPDQFQAACDHVTAGDAILVYGGIYDKRTTLTRKFGKPAMPIRIQAADEHWISGDKSPDPSRLPGIPAFTDPAFLCIDDCEHVIIDGLKIKNWWPGIVHAKETRWLTVRGCDLRHASYAIAAKDKRTHTSHLLIEDNHWQQDDSTGHDLWFKIDWKEAHGNEGSDGAFRYFNGGFFGAKAIRGQVILRRNRITDAYNGIRMKSGDKPPAADQLCRVNADVHIFDNDFIRIRDNPIEPEIYAYNWHIRHNRLLDCHAWFSFDGVTGGLWYLYGNTGRFQSRQGDPNADQHTMGRVLKLSYELGQSDPASERVPSDPWFVFNNSWNLRCPVIGGANATVPSDGPGPDFSSRLAFFNNAFTWCQLTPVDPRVCEYVEMVRHFDKPRSQSVLFDYDICDRADFMDFFQRPGWGEGHGVTSTRPVFALPINARFALAVGSEALGSGWTTPETRLAGLSSPRLQADGTLNRGALQDYGLTQVPNLERQASSLLLQIGALPDHPVGGPISAPSQLDHGPVGGYDAG